jgi:hypothetical protein
MPMSQRDRKIIHYAGYRYPILLTAIGVGSLVALFFLYNSGEPIDPQGVIVFSSVGLGGLGLGAFSLWLHGRQAATTPARRTRTQMLVIGLAFGLLSAFTAYQLVQLEYGGAQGVTLWDPIAWIYHSLGFWPAVLVVPTFTLLVIAGLARKLRAINEEQ